MAEEMIVKPRVETKMINRGSSYNKRQAKLEADEKEVEEMIKAQIAGEDLDTEEESVSEEEEVEASTEATEEDDKNLSREEKSFKKRYGDLRRHMAEKEKEWKSSLESNTNKALRAPKSDEDIEEWAAKYPDVAAIVETIAEKKAAERFDSADNRLQELDDAKNEAIRTKAETQIRKSHSDFDDLRESDNFHDWVDEQPKWVRDALYENSDDARSVIRVLDLYKIDNNMSPAARKSKTKDAAKTVKKRSSRVQVESDESASYLKESEIAAMSDKQFEEKSEEINEAMRSGKVIYDMSGRAR